MARPRSPFAARLAELDPGDLAGRRWVYAPYDQLTHAVGPLAEGDPGELGLVIVETPAKAARRPYHRQKLAFVLANQRQFALEQAARGVAVRHVVHADGHAPALAELADELGPLTLMRPAERELRAELAPLVERGALIEVPHAGWLTSGEDFRASQPDGPPYRMDAFYRAVRRARGVLMDADGKPVGGRFSFDGENRERWSGEPSAPEPPRFTPDAITREVGELVTTRFAGHPGTLDLSRLPATRDDAEALWAWALARCLPHFGPYEDAMSRRSTGLFHARVSALLNVHRLLPRRVIDDVLALDVPLNSKEGFVRQVLGWREFMRHVHEATDGLRTGYDAAPGNGTASPSFLGARASLPRAFWRETAPPVIDPDAASPGEVLAAHAPDADASDGGRTDASDGDDASDTHAPARETSPPSGLACLDTVVAGVWREAYSHHITRLMVLANVASLLDVDPRELTDWFWVAYADAYDWVVEPNVLGMGSFGAGDLLSTKPYVSGAAYIHRMGDFCKGCAFDPQRDCPITPLYWAFLARHEDTLADNPRLNLPYGNLARRPRAKRDADAATFERVRRTLSHGGTLEPERAASR